MSTMETDRIRSQTTEVTPATSVGPSEGRSDTGQRVAAGGSALEALGGVAVVVLGILGLAGVVPSYMAPIAAIIVGASLISAGGAFAARRTEGATGEGETAVGGLGAEVIAGLAGVVLGILALIGIVPTTLIAVSVIVFGTGLLLGCAAMAHFAGGTRGTTTTAATGEALAAAAGSQSMMGLATVILGILALVGFVPMTLNLVALLVLGVSLVLSGAAKGGKMASMMRRW